MIHFQEIWNSLLYAGVEKEEYRQMLPDIRKKNLALIKTFSLLSTVMFFLLLFASLLSRGFATINSMTYLICGIGMLIILSCSHFILPKYPAYIMVFVYIFEIMLYLFSIHISILHSDMVAVSAIAFLLVSPLLFYDRPVRMVVMIAAVVTIFCGIVLRFKSPDVAKTDIWNSITFGIVAVFTTVFMMSIKLQSLTQLKQIEHLSQTDLLTGAWNRNHYENRLQEYPEKFASNLICIYADVNGLHEMNYRSGHLAGDRMLREVAEAMQQCFGVEHTYRIGGDEFIAFLVDSQPEKLPAEIDLLKRSLGEKGYHVSFGISVREKASGKMNMIEIVNEAEINMFADKREFYRQSQNDRRSRKRL